MIWLQTGMNVQIFQNMSIISSHGIPCVVLVGSIGTSVIFGQYGKYSVFSMCSLGWVQCIGNSVVGVHMYMLPSNAIW